MPSASIAELQRLGEGPDDTQQMKSRCGHLLGQGTRLPDSLAESACYVSRVPMVLALAASRSGNGLELSENLLQQSFAPRVRLR